MNMFMLVSILFFLFISSFHIGYCNFNVGCMDFFVLAAIQSFDLVAVVAVD